MTGYGDHYNQTVLHPVGLAAVLILGIAILLLPRRYAIVPMLILACFIPSAQRLVIMGMDWSLIRILVLFGWTRLLVRNEFRGFRWNRLDTLVLAWMISGTIIYTVQLGTTSALINRCGWMFEGLGMYFLFRVVLKEWEDMERLAQLIVVLSIPVACAFILEYLTSRNVFSIFGGVPQITMEREGRLRCQGAFSHAILAGCFWATMMPLMVARFAQDKTWSTVCGLLATFVIVITCASSTPLMTVGFVAVGLALYPVRPNLVSIRWGFFATLVLLHFVMNKPVWHLFARVNVVGGSTGWHRYRIIDATVNNFREWWLVGEPYPMNWGVWEMRDITNQYILEALRGGLLTLVVFVTAIVLAFGNIGRCIKRVEGDPRQTFFIWCIGVTLFAHVWTFFAVSYFGQIVMLWYLSLAIAGSLPMMLETQFAAEEAEELESPPHGHMALAR